MKPRNILEVKGKAALSALALALSALPALAAEPDGHAFVRASILNTWTPTAVASELEGKVDSHELARRAIVGAPKPATVPEVANIAQTKTFDAHDQARRLLLAQPAKSQSGLGAVNRSGS